jgi:hypothetical protein
LAAVEKFSQREVGWKFLPGTGFTATVLDDNLHDLVTNPIFPQMSTPLMVRDPDTFVAGEVHKYGEVWDQLTRDIPNRAEVMGWITNRVSVRDYVQHFKGSFGGIDYDSREPMPTIFNNNHSCASFAEFISRTISERIEVGAVSVLGRVGECSPPIIVMPLTVEPNKPRLCQDQRYLNCWMKDMPFRLDSVVNLTRYVGQGHFQAKLDDKSGYDHVLMANDSRLWMGFQWGGVGGFLIMFSHLDGRYPRISTSPSVWLQRKSYGSDKFLVLSISMTVIWASAASFERSFWIIVSSLVPRLSPVVLNEHPSLFPLQFIF